MNRYKWNDYPIIGNKENDALWRYKNLLDLQRIYYSRSKHVLISRSYRNLILSRIPKPTYY